MRRAVLETARRPGGPMLWALLDWWWYGWRIGTERDGFPLGQPRAWRYGDLLLMATEPYLTEWQESRPIRGWLEVRGRSRCQPDTPGCSDQEC